MLIMLPAAIANNKKAPVLSRCKFRTFAKLRLRGWRGFGESAVTFVSFATSLVALTALAFTFSTGFLTAVVLRVVFAAARVLLAGVAFLVVFDLADLDLDVVVAMK